MTFDVVAAERLTLEVVRAFESGLRGISAAAAKEVAVERSKLEFEARQLSEDRARLNEAWNQLRAERSQLEVAAQEIRRKDASFVLQVQPQGRGMIQSAGQPLQLQQQNQLVHHQQEVQRVPAPTTSSHHSASLVSLARSGDRLSLPRPTVGGVVQSSATIAALQPGADGLAEISPLSLGSTCGGGDVPADCVVRIDGYSYTVLPFERPNAENQGHDMWNLKVDIPQDWEVLSTNVIGFDHAISTLTRHRWGAIVLGVRNANKGFDAYWTPLFGDGSHAGQRCQADVDWIEPADDEERRFRFTYSGLRLVVRSRADFGLSARLL
eukprot:TRINITY_DN29309_c0_g1_i1.p1 TRINITY_DN29309_c0_g1~~TRINITY_DN29309_c0_g1_i1.p1  ORF type:complete len:346 (-),score=57.02 TRINITY_DN29309_c0_g1_i1:105-1076(-)